MGPRHIILAFGALCATASAEPLPASSRVPVELAAAGYPAPKELYFDQALDHFNPATKQTWKHRYLLNQDNWGASGSLANGCPGPVLLYTGNEGPIDAFWNISGFVVETLAKSLGGLVLFSEQRYYGKSLPFGDASLTAENLVYLTTAQVVADHAVIAEHIKATIPNAKSCPVIAFGGSYGGTLTALIRATHPATITGGLAASSELGYYDEKSWEKHGVNKFTFEDTVVATLSAGRPGCWAAIQEAMAAVDAADTQKVVETFNVCDAKALGPGLKSGFFAYVLEGMPQGNYASNGAPVTAACDTLLAAQAQASPDALLKAAGEIVGKATGASSCIPFHVGGPGNTPGDGPGTSAWGWQSCTETIHTFNAHRLRNFTFDLAKSSALCSSLYNRTVAPDLDAITRLFGSPYDLADGTAGVTRLIWSQGTLDPWHGWFQKVATPQAQIDVHHFVIEGAAHHEDLRLPFDADRKSVTAARAKEEAIIRRWVTEASAVTDNILWA